MINIFKKHILLKSVVIICFRRGPNKYTRTWEDEAAYVKVAPTNVKTKKQKKPNGNNTEDFPPLVKTSETEDNSLNDCQQSTENTYSNERRSSNELHISNESQQKDSNVNRKSVEK